ncbi:MAG: DNA mismatch endonuclease Vsr [Sphaerochaetaceae bacterium]|nr:DNA mismatch endonuclease Vsr [Sphaerochaetaceae bacterium]
MDVFSFEKRSAVMASIRSGDTRCEWIVRRFLFSHGYRYRIHDKRLVGKPDIVLPKYRTVIFVHGCFWHGHSSCRYGRESRTNLRFWREKMLKNSLRDARVTESLRRLGWRVIVLWECELRSKQLREATLEGLLCEIQSI